jgi:hypothetical protein
MTVLNPGKPSRRKSVWGHNTTADVEDVYVCPANCTAEVTYIIVANGGGSTNYVTLQWYVAADNYTSHFLNDKSLAGDGYHEFSSIDLVLAPGDKIQVVPGAAGHIDSIITVTETFVPVG